MRKTAIICAIERELHPYLNAMENAAQSKKANLTFHEGKLCGKDVIVVYCGVCKVNAAIAAQILISEYGADAIICSGVAGGIDKNLKIGDTVISTRVAYHDVAKNILTDYHPFMKNTNFYADEKLLGLCKTAAQSPNFRQNIYFGKIVTGETFIDKDGRDEIIKKHSPLCVDMETGAIAHVCYVNEIPFIAVRSISDTEDESGFGSFETNCDYAAKNSFNIVWELLKRQAI